MQVGNSKTLIATKVLAMKSLPTVYPPLPKAKQQKFMHSREALQD
jgi:hypothetical protein